MYEGYKGQRQACPDAVKEAIPRLLQLLKAMAIPVIQVGTAGRRMLALAWVDGCDTGMATSTACQ